jgi:hypothetical protein
MLSAISTAVGKLATAAAWSRLDSEANHLFRGLRNGVPGSHLDECSNLPVALRSKIERNRNDTECYLSWLSLLPLRLNPAFTGRRSSAD